MEIKTFTNIGRFKDIIFTLIKYGLDDVVDRLDIPGKHLFGKIHSDVTHMSAWERIRRTLEDLGPTFVKFGQLMSLRPDLIPAPLIMELKKLQDEVPPVEFSVIKERIETELGTPFDETFFHFDETPIAAGSLAQVHRAILKNGRQVVAVKVQRPGIRPVIQKDLSILEGIAKQLDKRMETSQIYDLPNLVKEVKKTLLHELDFTREARNMKIAQINFSDTPEFCVPKVYESYSTEKVLTMELITGTKLKDLDSSASDEREILARLGVRCTLMQIIEHGFFHADPHPGNIMLLEGNRICLLDWGMVGRLTTDTRYNLIDLTQSIVEKDAERILWSLTQFVEARKPYNPKALQREILDILESIYGLSLAELNLGQLLLDITTLLREYYLRLPADLAVMIKALVTAEGTGRELYPELNVIAEAEPYVKKIAKQRWHPDTLWDHFKKGVFKFMAFQKHLPDRIDHIIELIDKGELNIHFQHENLEGLRRTLETITNRITFGIIIAALVIGSSMIITTGVKPFLFGFPALGVIGYLVSALLGLWLIFNIIRKKKF